VSLAPLMSSEKQDWRTPENVLDVVRRVDAIGLDPCASSDREHWFARANIDAGSDAFRTPWPHGGLIYVNPPYSRALPAWIAKCVEEAAQGAEIIACVPARPDTRWWRAGCIPGETCDAVAFWSGRVRFVGAPASAPFPTALIYWGERSKRFALACADVAKVWR